MPYLQTNRARRAFIEGQTIRLEFENPNAPDAAGAWLVKRQYIPINGAIPIKNAAQLLGITPTTIRRWAKADAITLIKGSGIPLRELVRLARYLDEEE